MASKTADPPRPARTIGELLHELFPKGTGHESGDIAWCPVAPTDLFAAAALLMERSGAYQYVVAPFSPDDESCSEFDYSEPNMCLSERTTARLQTVGREWRSNPRLGDSQWEGQVLWRELRSFEEARVHVNMTRETERPQWWEIAFKLLVIADEACQDLGYIVNAESERFKDAWFNIYMATESLGRTEYAQIGKFETSRHFSRHAATDTMAVWANPDLCRVMPKGRTAGLGVAMRTMSHNVALLLPQKKPHIFWHTPSSGPLAEGADANKKLNLLLIPFPYVIPPRAFKGQQSPLSAKKRGDVSVRPPWGRFRIDQAWLDPDQDSLASPASSPASEFAAFVLALLQKARLGGRRPIHGIVLPEYALTWEAYDALVAALTKLKKPIELLISGVSRDCANNEGNQVTFSIFRRFPRDLNHPLFKSAGIKPGEVIAETHSRRKHHRWNVTPGQVEQYDIAHALDPRTNWWEHHEVGERVLQIDVFRSGSVFTAMICEDLARVDPVVSTLRSIGPNLVFALLMDTAQMKGRWPDTYATTLADDPGSSVLTLTSLGLVERANAMRRRKGKTVSTSSRSIALWKNYPGSNQRKMPAAAAQELALSEGSHGLVIELEAEGALETTLDNRENSDATAWIMKGTMPAQVRIEASTIKRRRWEWITEGVETAKTK